MLITSSAVASWIGFGCCALAAAVIYWRSFVKSLLPEARSVYFLFAAANAVSALAYLLQALGGTEYVHERPDGTARGVEWLRYAQWVVSAPLTMSALGCLVDAPFADIAFASFSSALAVAALFGGALSTGFNATWPLYAFAIAVGVPSAVTMMTSFRNAGYALHTEVGKLYDVLAVSLLALAAGYAAVWGCSEGTAVMENWQEVVAYTSLDIAAKAVLGLGAIFGREAIARFGRFVGLLRMPVDGSK